MVWQWLRDPGQGEAGSRGRQITGPEVLTKFGLYLEGTGEPWKACEQGSVWEPEALSGLGQGLWEAEPETGSCLCEAGPWQGLLESQLHYLLVV